VAAVLSKNRTNALVVLDPWEVRVAMVAPTATVRRALLRERPGAVAANRVLPWLRRREFNIVPVSLSDRAASRPALPELRRFAGTRHEKLIASALALADEALNYALHEQLVSQDRSR
jgi:hypothetical protein